MKARPHAGVLVNDDRPLSLPEGRRQTSTI